MSHKQTAEAKLDWYFTFGTSHVHEVDGVTLDADVVLKIHDTFHGARERIFDAIGPKWCMQYEKHQIEKNMHYYPRGIVEVPSI